MVRMLREFIGSLDETKTPPIMAPGRSPAIEGLRIAWRGPFGPAPPSRVTIYPRKAAPSCWHAAQLFCRHCQALWSRRGRTETQPFSWASHFLVCVYDETGRAAMPPIMQLGFLPFHLPHRRLRRKPAAPARESFGAILVPAPLDGARGVALPRFVPLAQRVTMPRRLRLE